MDVWETKIPQTVKDILSIILFIWLQGMGVMANNQVSPRIGPAPEWNPASVPEVGSLRPIHRRWLRGKGCRHLRRIWQSPRLSIRDWRGADGRAEGYVLEKAGFAIGLISWGFQLVSRPIFDFIFIFHSAFPIFFKSFQNAGFCIYSRAELFSFDPDLEKHKEWHDTLTWKG